MKSFLIRIIQFGPAVVIVYLFLAWSTANIPALETRWNKGIPSWAKTASAGDKLRTFESFCIEQGGQQVNIIIGSSTGLHGIDPTILGPPWFNASTRGQNILISQVYLEILQEIAAQHNVIIDTILFDVYPEFQQKWVVQKQDAAEDMAQSLPFACVAKHSDVLLKNKLLNRLNSRVIEWIRRIQSKRPSSSAAKGSAHNYRGFEPQTKGSFRTDFQVPFDGDIDSNIIDQPLVSPEKSAFLFHNPPTMHPNHLDELLVSIPWLITFDWINGHSFKDIQDTAYFSDDHHMNEEGARVYSTWLRSQLSNRP